MQLFLLLAFKKRKTEATEEQRSNATSKQKRKTAEVPEYKMSKNTYPVYNKLLEFWLQGKHKSEISPMMKRTRKRSEFYLKSV